MRGGEPGRGPRPQQAGTGAAYKGKAGAVCEESYKIGGQSDRTADSYIIRIYFRIHQGNNLDNIGARAELLSEKG